MYLRYYAIIIILVEKWSQNNNIIVYRNNYWDNLPSSKMCYRDWPINKDLILHYFLGKCYGENINLQCSYSHLKCGYCDLFSSFTGKSLVLVIILIFNFLNFF